MPFKTCFFSLLHLGQLRLYLVVVCIQSCSQKVLRAIGCPVDNNLIFIIFSAIYLSAISMTVCFPLSVDHQKIVKNGD